MSSCLIIGAGPGIGAAVARRFAAADLPVGLIARSRQTLAPLQAELVEAGHTSVSYPADAGDADSLAGTLRLAMNELGPPHSVVYNAAAWPPGDLLALAPDELLSSLAVNAVGPVAAAQTCADRMTAGASFLITGGGIVFAPDPDMAALSVGKTANRLVSALLSQTLAPRGIHVATVLVAGTVAPGTRFGPDDIAGELWRLHRQSPEAWEHETIWR